MKNGYIRGCYFSAESSPLKEELGMAIANYYNRISQYKSDNQKEQDRLELERLQNCVPRYTVINVNQNNRFNFF